MKNTTINIIEKRREVDKLGIYRADAIIANTNATLLAIAEGEVARLEGERKWHKEFECNGANNGKGCFETFCEDQNCRNAPNGHNNAINDQILHWKEIISFLNK